GNESDTVTDVGTRATASSVPRSPVNQSCSTSSQVSDEGINAVDATTGEAVRLFRRALPSDSNPRTIATEAGRFGCSEGTAMKMRPLGSTVNGALPVAGTWIPATITAGSPSVLWSSR